MRLVMNKIKEAKWEKRLNIGKEGFYNNYIGLLLVILTFSICCSNKYLVSLNNIILILSVSLIVGVVINHYFVDQVKDKKKGYILIILFVILWAVMLNSPWTNKLFNHKFDVQCLSHQTTINVPNFLCMGAVNTNSNNSNEALDNFSLHFDMYSWYITLIISILTIIAGIFVYYNWSVGKRIKDEWENYFKKETEANKAFCEIRSEVINDPRLGNGKDEEKLQGFTRTYREGQIDRALKYAFVARDMQPEIKLRGNYNDEEKQQWERALQYWILAAYILPEKDTYQKEHIGFIYDQMGNAFREIANYAVYRIYKKNGENNINNAFIPMIKGILSYYVKALSAYEFVLDTDSYNKRVLNNEANLLMEVYHLQKKLLEGKLFQKESFKELWDETLALHSNLWSKLIENGNEYGADNLIIKAHQMLEKAVKVCGLSSFDILKNDVFYYRNYAIACYLKLRIKHPDPSTYENYKKEVLYNEFIDYLEKYFVMIKDKRKAILELKEDEDLKDAIEEDKVRDLFKIYDDKYN